MSGYPQAYGTGYAGSYGSHDQQHLPYTQQAYQTQYAQQDDGQTGYFSSSNYDNSMSAYRFNNALPNFTAPPVPPAEPLPIFQAWNQDHGSLPPYTAPPTAPQYADYQGNEQYNMNYGPPGTQQSYQYNAGRSAPYDEGELSEGEFDDRGGAPQHNASASASIPHAAGQIHENGPYADAAHHAFYPEAQEFDQHPRHGNEFSYNRAPRTIRRDEPLSYSPYVVTNENISRENHTKENPNHSPFASDSLPTRPNGALQNNSQKSLGKIETPSQSVSRANGHTPPNGSSQLPVVATLSTTQDSDAKPSRLSEAKKRAQGAILNLWPLEVRFQNYIDEGFDESLVGRLFDDLGMPRALAQSASEYRRTPKVKKVFSELPSASKNRVGSPLTEVVSKSSMFGDAKNKDGTALSSSTNTGDGTTIALPAKPAGTTEKERALQLKLEALRKSREERAQKAAAKNRSKPEALLAAEPVPEREPLKIVAVAAPSASPSNSKPSPAPQPPQNAHAQIMPTNLPVTANHQAPVIPGLFLTSSTFTLPLSSNHIVNPVSQRKRPVAADFDTPSMAFRRPFGQNRHEQPLVIDVSEEEGDSDDEDVEMDLESQADHDSPTHGSRKMSDARKTAIQSLPSLSSFPSHKPFTPPPASSATSTPSLSQSASKSILGRPEDLLKKETEIELLKKKIAEAEARRKARQTPSGIRTPHANDATTEGKVGKSEDIASKVEASIKMQSLIGIAENDAKSAQRKLADVQAAELLKAEELKRNEAEQKRLRREKIAADLPRVDAEVFENQSRLEQLRLEMARVEAAVQKSLEDKRRLAEEMERLGQETEIQLQAQRDRLNDLTQTEAETTNDDPQPVSSSAPNTVPESVLPMNTPDLESNPTTSEAELPAIASAQPVANEQSPVQSEHGQLSSDVGKAHAIADVEISLGTAVVPDQLSADHVLEAALQDAVRAEAEAQAPEDGDKEMDDSYAPEPRQLALDPSVSAAEEESRSRPQSSCPEVEMSDRNDESDDYEPPEASPPADHYSPPYSPSFSPAARETVVSMEVCSSVTGEPDVDQVEPKSQEPEVTSLRQLQESGTTDAQHYTPYESPLQLFRAYRFHPEFKQKITGGLRSMSYSNKIDPNKEFCRYELAGGVCNDPECEFQHFRDIRLPDDAVLTALGSPDEFTGDQRENFCTGLRQVLNDLRERKIRDFDVIASEIVAHRSKFLGDPSKVLMLEGTTI